MVQLPNRHVAGDHEPHGTPECIPEGTWVIGIITESLWKATKAMTGHYLALTFEVTHGPQGKYHGRKVWEQLNIDNPNQTAKDIANGRLTSICNAIGLPHCDQSEQLHGKPIALRLGVEQKDQAYPPKNIIRQYLEPEKLTKEGPAPEAGAPPSVPQGGPKAGPAASSKTMPWE